MTELSFGVHENVSVSKVQGVEVDSGPDDLYGGLCPVKSIFLLAESDMDPRVRAPPLLCQLCLGSGHTQVHCSPS